MISTTKSKRGFAAMKREDVQAIGRKGGEKRKRQLGSAGYAEMGQKGGRKSHRK